VALTQPRGMSSKAADRSVRRRGASGSSQKEKRGEAHRSALNWDRSPMILSEAGDRGRQTQRTGKVAYLRSEKKLKRESGEAVTVKNKK